MESMVKKYQQRFRKVKDEMDKWDSLDSSFLSQFRNASSIINRLQVIRDSKNYGTLSGVDGIVHMVLRKQMDSLQNILISMYKSLDEFRAIVLFLERIQRDGRHLFSGDSSRLTTKQLQQRVGIKPCLIDCMDGLTILHDMHHSDSGDLAAFQQLLVDQPNIPKEEVKFIFDVIFAEEIC